LEFIYTTIPHYSRVQQKMWDTMRLRAGNDSFIEMDIRTDN